VYVRQVVVVVVGGGGGGDQGPEPRLRLHCSLLFTLFLEVPLVAARCLHVLRDARGPSSEKWNLMGEKD
jgi:hypothetical protein